MLQVLAISHHDLIRRDHNGLHLELAVSLVDLATHLFSFIRVAVVEYDRNLKDGGIIN